MARLAILVDIRTRGGQAEAFRQLLLENAERSVVDEPGCLRFDVLEPRSEQASDTVRLYEVYSDDEAFELHQQTAHYLRFKEATIDMIETIEVERFDVTEHGGERAVRKGAA